METAQVVCSSPLFYKLEPESPPSWDTVDFTESNFGEYWPDDWEDEKESVDIKSFAHGDDILMDLDLLMKEGKRGFFKIYNCIFFSCVNFTLSCFCNGKN